MKKCLSLLLVLVLVTVQIGVMPVYADEETVVQLSEEDRVQAAVEALFEEKRAFLSDEKSNLNVLSELFITQPDTVSDREFWERCIIAERETLRAGGNKYKNTSMDLRFDKIVVSGIKATVEVYEWFSFEYYDVLTNESVLNMQSGMGLDYEITLVKEGDSWLIDGFSFDDPAYESLKDPNVSITSVVQGRMTSDQERVEFMDFGPVNDVSSVDPCVVETVTVTINRNRAVAYALQYAGNLRNPLFLDCSSSDLGGDCQNYASQCIWYGLGGINTASAINSHAAPMIDISGNSWNWYMDDYGYHSASWTAVNPYANYIAANNTILGLYGTVYTGVRYAQIGDVIQISDSDGFYHSYIVVQTTGTFGSRTPANIYVCAHTRDITTTQLSTISADSSIFRTVRVNGVRYPDT